MKRLLVVAAVAILATAVGAGVGARSAAAGEVTGNCNHAKSEKAADNCKTDQNANANSICSFSGQNDNPESTDPENPGGKTQSYGQAVRAGGADPRTENPSNPPDPDATPHPGAACNGEHGFLSGS
ncbi:MAG TPA: hypothetical protein VFT35_12105 [Gaiellaceae bacterium]|jgi:hypothetical protein|nr:hypothetical protein [Gaiellaceae bacterium]